MKKIVTIVGIFLVLLTVVFSTGAAPIDSKDISADITELKKEVLSLRERIKSLEERLVNATIIVPGPKPKIDNSIIKVPEALHRHRCIPKGWQQRQFNGHLYYVIPLDKNIINFSRRLEK